MKGYKASINGKCRNQVYEVGKTYKIEFESKGKIKLCYRGFHFCEKPNDIFNYYEASDNNLVIFEVEALGTIKTSGDKSVTDEIKIIREIPKKEYNSLFTKYEFKYDEHNNLIWLKDYDGDIWEFKYDSNNNRIFESDSDGAWLKSTYDENNNKIVEYDSFGYGYEFKYDSNNNCIFEKDSNGYIREYKYDSNNNLIWFQDSNGYIREYKYDSNNNLIFFKNTNSITWKYPSYKVISY